MKIVTTTKSQRRQFVDRNPRPTAFLIFSTDTPRRRFRAINSGTKRVCGLSRLNTCRRYAHGVFIGREQWRSTALDRHTPLLTCSSLKTILLRRARAWTCFRDCCKVYFIYYRKSLLSFFSRPSKMIIRIFLNTQKRTHDWRSVENAKWLNISRE